MTELFKRLDYYLDYYSSYSMKKALNTLNSEFNLAIKKKDRVRAQYIIKATKELYDKFTQLYGESEKNKLVSSFHKAFIQKMQWFLSYLIKQTNLKFGG